MIKKKIPIAFGGAIDKNCLEKLDTIVFQCVDKMKNASSEEIQEMKEIYENELNKK